MSEYVELAKKGDAEAIQDLIKAGSLTRDQIGECLYHACHERHKTLAEMLVSEDVDPNYAIYVAAFNGWLDVVESMLALGADANPESGLPLTWAVKSGNIEMVELMLNHGADVNIQKGRPIVFAAHVGSLPIVELLVKNGADVNPAANSPLSVARIHEFKAIADYLVSKGAIPYEEYDKVGV